jgi:hypothetical protein
MHEPEVQFNSVRVLGVGLRGATIEADMTVGNPYDHDIVVDSISYVFEASDPKNTSSSWSRVTSGTYRDRITIKDSDRTEVRIPVDLNYTGLAGPIASILNMGTFNYRMSGNVYVTQPVHKPMSYSKTGNLSLAGAR